MDRIVPDRPSASPSLDFLWLELTNRCNLRCVHCYAESAPDAEVDDPLSTAEYVALLEQAFDAGCRQVQFIGGEPTLHRELPLLIERAAGIGYAFIEVYANLTRLPDTLLDCVLRHGVNVATSLYAPTADIHDRITRVPGSFERTVAHVRQLLAAGVPVRASIVEMAENAGSTDATRRFLHDELGVSNVKVDRARPFGRASDAQPASMHELCGTCAGGTLCVAPDGRVSACIMSKQWSVGSVKEEGLRDIVQSQRLRELRASIGRAVRALPGGTCDPDTIGCPPLNQCGPKINPAVQARSGDHAYRAQSGCDPSSQCGPVIGCPPLNRCGPEINGARLHDRSPS